MKVFKVTIAIQEEVADSKYNWDTVYEQQFGAIDIASTVSMLNLQGAKDELAIPPQTTPLSLDPLEDNKQVTPKKVEITGGE